MDSTLEFYDVEKLLILLDPQIFPIYEMETDITSIRVAARITYDNIVLEHSRGSIKNVSFLFPGFEKCFILKRRQMVQKVEKNMM